MDYEKKYKEAIKRASNIHKDAVEMENSMVTKTCEVIFPELKESEDERIRKDIKQHFLYLDDSFPDKAKWLNWLEKQGEQKPNVCEGCNNVKGCIACVDGSEWAYIEEQNPAWSEEDENTLRTIISDGIRGAELDMLQIDWLKSLKDRVQPQQKREWNEEDEERLSDAIFFVREYQIPTRDKRLLNAAKETEDWLKSLKDRVGCEVNCTTTKEWDEEDEGFLDSALWHIQNSITNGKIKAFVECPLSTWLKSLKNRVKQQKQQKWSEEDKKMFKETLALIETVEDINKAKDGFLDVKMWLKSLKERYTWEPSDEQMELLKEACDQHWEPDGLDPLYTLYQDLKKLRGE